MYTRMLSRGSILNAVVFVCVHLCFFLSSMQIICQRRLLESKVRFFGKLKPVPLQLDDAILHIAKSGHSARDSFFLLAYEHQPTHTHTRERVASKSDFPFYGTAS